MRKNHISGTDLLSIIIPVYNVKKYLSICINSVLSQTYQNLEIILVDDGSSDGSEKICDDYAEKDKRIRVIHQKNAGVAKARNAGLDVANGVFIGFVDADDYIESNMYETLYNHICDAKAEIAQCGLLKKSEDDGRVKFFVGNSGRITKYTGKESLQNLLTVRTPWCYVCTKLFCATLFQQNRFDINLKIGEDSCILANIFLRVKAVVYLEQPLYHYRENFSSLTSGISVKNLDTLKSDSYVEKLIESNSPHLLDYAYQAFENDALSLYAKLLLMPGKKSIHYKMKRIIRSEIICRCSKVILSKKCKIKVKLKLIFAIAVPNFYAFIYWLWRLLFRFNLYEIWLKLFCIH